EVQGAGRVDLSEQSLGLSELSVHREELEFLAGVQAGRKGEEWILSLNDLRLNGHQLPGEVILSTTGTDPHVAVRCGTMDISLWQDLFQKTENGSKTPLFQGILYELTHARGKLDIAVESVPWSDLDLKDVRLTGSLAGGEVRLRGTGRLPGGQVRVDLQGLACPEQMTGQGDFELMDASGKSVFTAKPVFVLVPDKLGVRFELAPVSVAAVKGVTGRSGVTTGWPEQVGGHGTLAADASGVRLSFSELTADELTLAGSAHRPAGSAAWDVNLDFTDQDPGPFFSGFNMAAPDSGSRNERSTELFPRELGSVTVHNLAHDEFRINKATLTGTGNGTMVRFSITGAAYGRSVRGSGDIAKGPGGIRVSVAGQGEILPGRTLKVEAAGLLQPGRHRFLAEKVAWSLEHAGVEAGTLTGSVSGVVDIAEKRADLKMFSAKGDILDCSGPISLVWSAAPGLSGKLDIRSLKLVSLLQDWGLKLWPMADFELLNNISGTTAVSLDRTRVLFDISGVRLDKDSTVSGKVTIRLDRPEITLDLDAGYLKLDRLLPGAQDGKDRRKKPKKKRRLVVNGGIRARTVDWRKLRFSDAFTRLALKGGTLHFSPLSATLHGGRVKGAILLDLLPDPSRLDVFLNGSGVELGPFMTRVTGSPKLTGTMDLALDISGTPGGRGGYPGGLGGTMQLDVRQGSIALEQDHPQAFDVLRGSGKITRGRLTCQDFFATFGRSTATGGALIDLGGQTVDGTFVVETPSVSLLASIPVLNRVKTLTDLSRLGWPSLTFDIRGDLMKPQIVLDRERLALDVGREVVTAPVTVGERVLDAGKNIVEFGGKAAGKVVETIGGLFGMQKEGKKETQNGSSTEEP
ncbi:MAG TPA: AsmA family protein, partial [Desulfomicrobiaceae bacterium]|nr:AsmA family protein [Desulfomicrobiaceae bacterium]